jgi:hypothetical protein
MLGFAARRPKGVRGASALLGITLAMLTASCADRNNGRAKEVPANMLSNSSTAAATSYSQLISDLPDADLFSSVSLDDAAPPAAEAIGSGKWLSMISNASTTISRFEVRWEAEVVTGALWYENGESNSVISGGGLTFASPSPSGEDDGMHYAFSNDASGYLYTNESDSPSRLSTSPTDLQQTIEENASQVGIDVSSIKTFSVLGTDVLVLASADSFANLNLNASLFGDPGELEGACLVVVDRSGNPIYLWSYATGLQVGHGGGGGSELLLQPSASDSITASREGR